MDNVCVCELLWRQGQLIFAEASYTHRVVEEGQTERIQGDQSNLIPNEPQNIHTHRQTNNKFTIGNGEKKLTL